MFFKYSKLSDLAEELPDSDWLSGKLSKLRRGTNTVGSPYPGCGSVLGTLSVSHSDSVESSARDSFKLYVSEISVL